MKTEIKVPMEQNVKILCVPGANTFDLEEIRAMVDESIKDPSYVIIIDRDAYWAKLDDLAWIKDLKDYVKSWPEIYSNQKPNATAKQFATILCNNILEFIERKKL